ncbi:DUF4255 domain-containing protein [Tolypothrix sp. FACHB-123]|uniref:DUF4255 domain-containing protein n=1 Tax=Tolypothrix sp. FACHB-123 TaxID=2692868 RepID=UPI0016895125|nr:DUF4255 domain-containing protein [Tolypothrix sp. FACHB-123]MBD2357564.1 DUF4255 domain-containing protein [Tolypothrix sp. FACHB-123]
MSNSVAIAAVTATLRNLIASAITDELGSGVVTTQPPDKARENGNNGNQINIFLYQVLPNAALRNRDLPPRVKPGETGQAPLALNLYYMLTAYGKDNDDVLGHRLLGRAMQVLHDYPVLDPALIKSTLAESDLQNQIEKVRFTLQPLNLEDISKLWTTFQTQYRISAAYEASVVLIDSSLRIKSPLPVLTRGPGDYGVFAQADLLPPFPAIETLQIPNQQTSARLSEIITLEGHHLDSDDERAIVILHNFRLPNPIQIQIQQQTKYKEITFELPNRPADIPAGFYTVKTKLLRNGKEQVTNALPLTVAPQLQELNLSDRTLTLNFTPQVWREQSVALLLSDREILPQIDTDATELPEKTNTLTFDLTKVPAGDYFVRLRVDGVDSLLINRSVKPPVFDSRQKITLS